MGSGKGGCGLTCSSSVRPLPLCFKTLPKTLSPYLLATIHASNLFSKLSLNIQ